MSIQEEESRVIRAGANEFKLIEFHVGGLHQGINLVKVKKIIGYNPENITTVAETHAAVEGILEVDGNIIQILNLKKIYGFPEDDGKSDDQKVVIITEFNNTMYGFVVDNIARVHRISWKQLQPVGKTCPTDMVVGVASVEEGLDILMVDFETIIARLFPKAIKLPAEDALDIPTDIMKLREKAVVICADDSKVIRKKLKYIFQKHKFPNVTVCDDGGEAYNVLMARNREVGEEPKFTFMVTDIEMPQMNGLTLCKKVKDELADIPVLILSSLITQQMMRKCLEVNADAALSKNDMDSLVREIDRLLLEQDAASRGVAAPVVEEVKAEVEEEDEGHLKISAA